MTVNSVYCVISTPLIFSLDLFKTLHICYRYNENVNMQV